MTYSTRQQRTICLFALALWLLSWWVVEKSKGVRGRDKKDIVHINLKYNNENYSRHQERNKGM